MAREEIGVKRYVVRLADKLQSDHGEHARSLWAAEGKQAFEDG